MKRHILMLAVVVTAFSQAVIADDATSAKRVEKQEYVELTPAEVAAMPDAELSDTHLNTLISVVRLCGVTALVKSHDFLARYKNAVKNIADMDKLVDRSPRQAIRDFETVSQTRAYVTANNEENACEVVLSNSLVMRDEINKRDERKQIEASKDLQGASLQQVTAP